MKKVLMILLMLVITYINGVFAQAPDVTHIGLYNFDYDWRPGSSCATSPTQDPFYPVDVYVYCLPDAEGLLCIEFSIEYPGNVIQSTVSQNDDIISVTLGDLPSGMSVCYTDCQYGWHWVFQQRLYATDLIPSWIEIREHPSTGYVGYANCWDT